jgi:FKBP-type peptidyl-prolyl cis-trans isomerase 2
MAIIKKSDFVELKYTGFTFGKPFDSNIENDLKTINPEAKPQKTVVIIGKRMVISGLDDALVGKEVGKEFEIDLKSSEAFGERKRDLVKIIPLKIFTEKKINPYPGLVLAMDNSIAKIVAVSGARVTTDFNNPLAGKDVHYKCNPIRILEDEKEKVEVLFNDMLRFVPEFEIKDKIVVKGPKNFEVFIKATSPTFKEIIGKELDLEIIEPKKEEIKTENNQIKSQESSSSQLKQ